MELDGDRVVALKNEPQVDDLDTPLFIVTDVLIAALEGQDMPEIRNWKWSVASRS